MEQFETNAIRDKTFLHTQPADGDGGGHNDGVARPWACLDWACPWKGTAYLPAVFFAFSETTVKNLLALSQDFMDSVRPTSLSWPLFACYYVLMASFLALGPYMGFRNGLEPRLCLAVHLIATWAFIAYVPNQFAFGAVQLYFNSWYCFPRVIFLGWNKADEVSKRVDDGWDVFSLGFLLLMPVVFAEMLACDAIYRNWGGHFLYDGSILLIGTFYARTLWRQCEEVPVPKKSV